ncbi:MAG: PKD domain-containing protein, partial [Bacteroidia bacterium]|nr:PKD domain-containing protein [Bacteroidia bacterium]
MLFLNTANACTGITPRMDVTTSGICLPKTVTISNTSTGSRSSTAIYELYVNNQKVDTAHGKTKTFTLSLHRGTHQLKLRSIDTSGCIDSTQTSVTISRQTPRFLDYQSSYADTPQWINCIQLSTDPDSFVMQTKNEDTLNTLTVIWGDGNSNTFSALPKDSTLQHLYVNSGIFTLLFITTDTSGCVDTVYGQVTNERVPTAGIIGPNSGFNIGCAPFPITFTNNSKNISNGTVFTWDFGDGSDPLIKDNITFNQKLVHTYNSTLCNATVQLTASNSCGFSLTTWNPIQISQKDEARFTIDSTNCDSSGFYRFRNISTDSFCIFPDTKQFYWDFGDGTNSGWISSKGDQLHNYKTQGPKTVCLIAKNDCGEDTTCLPLTIVYTPVVGFEYDTLSGCESVTVNIRDTSIGYGLTRSWLFGDGTSSSAKQVSHTYTQPGTYNLRLTVGNRCGSKTRTETVVIHNKPEALFTGLTNGCVVHSVDLTNTSTSDFAGSVAYKWDFGNGDTSVVTNPTGIQYADSGTYTVQLIATDTCGSDTTTQQVRVDRLPVIDVKADSAFCSLDTVHFTNTSSDYDLLVLNYGDGHIDSVSSNGVFYHTFTTSGTYAIAIEAINNGICKSFDTISVRIKPNSLARFSLNDTIVCAPFTFEFTNLSQHASSYQWFINDTLKATTSAFSNLTIYDDTTVTTVKLIALDTIGCLSDTITQDLITARDPIAQLMTPIDSGCGPLSDTLLNTSLYAERYTWTLGNSSQSTSTNPAVVYQPNSQGDTTYSIELIAFNWL